MAPPTRAQTRRAAALLAGVLAELLAVRVGHERGRQVPRGVKRKMSNFHIRPRRRGRVPRRRQYTVRILK